MSFLDTLRKFQNIEEVPDEQKKDAFLEVLNELMTDAKFMVGINVEQQNINVNDKVVSTPTGVCIIQIKIHKEVNDTDTNGKPKSRIILPGG